MCVPEIIARSAQIHLAQEKVFPNSFSDDINAEFFLVKVKEAVYTTLFPGVQEVMLLRKMNPLWAKMWQKKKEFTGYWGS